MPHKTLLKRQEYHKKYRKAHKKEFQVYSKRYYNKPGIKEHYQQYRKTHPFVMQEEWKIAKKAWHERNKIRRYTAYKEYRKRNLVRMKARDQRRAARVFGAKGTITIAIIQRVYENNIKRFGTLTCYLCLQKVPFGKDHLEHRVPLSRSGTHYYNNLAVACQRCNLSKKDKTEKEYRAYALLVSSVSK